MSTQATEEGNDIRSARSTTGNGISWWHVASVIYALVASVLLLRLLVGVMLTWRLARTARPIGAFRAMGSRVCMSDLLTAPVTFSRTILLPPEYRRWNLMKRKAVLSHEGSHVAHGDFYVLLLASLESCGVLVQPILLVAANASRGVGRDHQ